MPFTFRHHTALHCGASSHFLYEEGGGQEEIGHANEDGSHEEEEKQDVDGGKLDPQSNLPDASRSKGGAGHEADGVCGEKTPFGAGGRGMLLPMMGTARSRTKSV